MAVAILGAVLGGLQLAHTMLYAETASQQASGEAIAVALAVVPYCWARISSFGLAHRVGSAV